MRWLRAGIIGLAVASIVTPSAANACTESTGRRQIFFPVRPLTLPAGLIVLHVRAPATADEGSAILVDVLGPADGVRDAQRVRIRIEPKDNARPCDLYDLGVLDEPAYVVGVYEEGSEGTYFRAMWVNAVFPKWREPKDWRSYIVDPQVKAAAGRQ